jgi:diacylglycerol kinase (ATP)
MQEGTLETVTETKHPTLSAILIANPTSGSYAQNEQQIKDTQRYLRSHGWQAELRLTRNAGDAKRMAREAVEQQTEVVVAIGGDGTINEIIQELAGSETALGVLPSGTVNVWAREVGIPLDNEGAREVLIHGQTRRIDLGQINDRYFLLMAGIGMDGEIAHTVEKKSFKKLGVLGYLLVASWHGFGYKGFRCFIQMEGRIIRINALQIVIGNTQLYGGAIKYTWLAKCDDGLLDLSIVRRRGILERLLVLKDLLLHRQKRSPWIRYEIGKEIKLRTKQTVAIQIDGDAMGYITPGYPSTIIKVAPGALKVIVPQSLPSELFVERSQEK